jgi:hypothetical protein
MCGMQNVKEIEWVASGNERTKDRETTQVKVSSSRQLN